MLILVWMLLVLSLIINVQADQRGFISVDCGATNAYKDSKTGLNWVPDDDFINVGSLTTLPDTDLMTVLKTLRVFPNTASTGKSLRLCLARNEETIGDPFISAIELRVLESSMYNSTDFGKYALRLVSRHNFGYSGSNIIRYPDDPYDRFWQPFQDSHNNVSRKLNTTVRGFWNIPPPKALEIALAEDKLEAMEIQWPNKYVSNGSYYIALYFQNLDIAQPQRLRIFNISVNGVNFFSELNVSTIPLMVYASSWTLSGLTNLILTPAFQSSLGPIINAGEAFEVFSLGGRTITRDVIALNEIKKSFINVPSDWKGDPCLPIGYSWTGVTCSQGSRIRVQILNLTSAGLSGLLSPSIAKLTALSHIWLGNNNLSGPIPDLDSLKLLSSLHLEGNKLIGEIPKSLTQLNNLSELFLQDNQLSGEVPKGLSNNSRRSIVIYPGNPLLVDSSLAPALAPARFNKVEATLGLLSILFFIFFLI